MLVGAAVLAMSPACSADPSPPVRSAQARAEATEQVLDDFLTPEGAAAEARRLVELCATLPDEMFREYNRIEDPDGPELFDDLDAVENRAGISVGAATLRGREAAEAACTPEDLERMLDLQNI